MNVSVSRNGGFLIDVFGNHATLDHFVFSIETRGDLGIHHFKKPPYENLRFCLQQISLMHLDALP